MGAGSRRRTLVVASLVAAAVAATSAWPGWAETAVATALFGLLYASALLSRLGDGSLLLGALGFLVGVFALVYAIVEFGNRVPRLLRRSRAGRGAVLLAIVTVGLIALGVPRHLAFLASRDAFESHLDHALRGPVAASPPRAGNGHPYRVPGERMGVFGVDDYQAHGDGVYFRVTSRPAAAFRVVSHGFAYRPDEDGSPYGSGGYRLRRVTGDWYAFRAWENAD